MMDAPRSRVGSLLEWMVAAAVTAAIVIAGFLVSREVRTIQAAAPVQAGTPAASGVPAGVPPRAVSVPVLLLPDGKEIHVGDRAAAVARRLGDAAHVASETVDRGARSPERVTRVYSYAGMQFVLVIEGVDEMSEPRVTAIYLK